MVGFSGRRTALLRDRVFTRPLLEHNSNKPFADRPLWGAIALLRRLALDLSFRVDRQLLRARACDH